MLKSGIAKLREMISKEKKGKKDHKKSKSHKRSKKAIGKSSKHDRKRGKDKSKRK